MKRFLAVLLSTLMLLALFAGCAPKDEAPADDTPASTAPEADADTEDTGDDEPEGTPVGNGTLTLTEDPVDLTFWLTVNDPEDETEMENNAFDEIVAGFMEKYPQVTITLEGIGAEVTTSESTIGIAASADNFPELFYFTSPAIKGWAPAGVIVEFGQYMSDDFYDAYLADPLANANFFAPNEGEVWAAVTDNAIQGWYINTKILADHDLEVPKTFDELLNVVTVLDAAGITPISHGGSDNWSIWGYHPWAWRYGFSDEQAAQLDKGEITFEDSAFMGYFNSLAELAAAGAYADDVGATKFDTGAAMFLEGQTAFFQVYNLWRTGQIELYESDPEAYASYGEVLNNATFSYGFDFDDDAYEEDEVVGIKLNCWSVFVGSCAAKDPQKLAASVAFIEYMASEEAYEYWVAVNSTIPLTWTSENTPDYSQYMLEQATIDAYEIEGYYRDEPNTVIRGGGFVDNYRNAVNGIICGTLDAAGAIDILNQWQITAIQYEAE